MKRPTPAVHIINFGHGDGPALKRGRRLDPEMADDWNCYQEASERFLHRGHGLYKRRTSTPECFGNLKTQLHFLTLETGMETSLGLFGFPTHAAPSMGKGPSAQT